jgi:hypothetical protein
MKEGVIGFVKVYFNNPSYPQKISGKYCCLAPSTRGILAGMV